MSATAGRELQVAVLGAGGTIAPALVRDLCESPEVAGVRALDLDLDRAEAVAAAHGAGKTEAAAVDASDPDRLAAALESIDVLVNSASYRLNLAAMDACLAAGCHYFDLGGLSWMTQRQLELGERFERAELLGVLGIGSSPGKTNLMALHGVRALGEKVDSIEVAAAGRDPLAPADGRLRPPYALQTLIDELKMEPVVLRDGAPMRIEALSDGGTIDFGPPVGAAATIYTLHSELATFGESFGCRQASFRLSLTPTLLGQLRTLAAAGTDEVAAAARGAAPQSDQTVSVHLVEVASASGASVHVRAFTEPHFGIGGSIVSTAAPAAAAVRLLARGSLSARGVHPPERCLQPELMFAELAQRGCTIALS